MEEMRRQSVFSGEVLKAASRGRQGAIRLRQKDDMIK
jgi:hypothetical protein